MTAQARILIVEDDAIIAAHLSQVIRQHAYSLAGTASSGEEAVTQAAALRPDLILMDIHLQGQMNGVEASLIIRRDYDIPIVFLTAFADENQLGQALRSQPYAYLTKPVREQELKASIEVALYKHQVDRKLNHLNQVLHSMREVGRLVTRQQDATGLMEEACQILVQTRDYRHVWFSQAEAGALKVVVSMGEAKGFIAAVEGLNLAAPSPWSAALQSLRPVVTQDFQLEAAGAGWREAALAHGFASSAAIPMLYNGRTFGLLCLESDLPQAFDSEEINLLQEMANDLAYALNNIAEEIQHRHAEEIVRRNEARLHSVYLISQFQAENEQQFLKFMLHEALQLSSSQAGWISFFQPGPADGVMVSRDGGDGWEAGCENLAAELLEKTGAREKLRRQSRPVIKNRLAAASPLEVVAGEKRLAISNYLVAPLFVSEHPGANPERAPTELGEMKARPGVLVGAAVVVNKEGDYDELDVQQFSQLIDAGWKIVERNRALSALQESEQRYRLVSEFTYDWEYWINNYGEWIFCSPSCERITGYAPRHFLENRNFLRQIIYPEDRAAFEEHSSLATSQHVVKGIDFRITCENGEVRWISHFCQPVYSTSGKYLGLRASNRDISSRKETEDALRKSEERYRLLFSNLTSAFALHEIILDDTGVPIDYRFIEVNPAFEKLTGLPASNLIGKRVKEVLPLTEPYWIETYGWVATHGESIRFENYSKEINKYFDVVAFCPTLGQFAVIFSDITERKNAEALVERRVAELEVLYENSLAISRLLEPQEIGQKITEILSQKLEWNHAAVRAFNGQTGKLELLALHRRGADGHTLEIDKQRLQSIISKPGQGVTGWVIEHGKPVRCNEVSEDPRYIETFPGIRSGLYVPIQVGEKIIGAISVESINPEAFDEEDERLLTTVAAQAAIAMENARLYQAGQMELGERRRAEEALRLLNQELEQRVSERTRELRSANAELERASRLKDEFLASMSHELRTPLTGVLNLSEALQEQVYGPLTEKQFKSLRTIEDSGRHLLGLINDILDLSKIEAGQFKLQFDQCHVSDICQSSLQMVRGLAQKKNHNLSFSLKPTDMELRADPRRMKQILVNLLSNAVKFTPEGGQIGLEVTGDEVERVIRFTVWDKGIGISEADQQRLFQPFTQLDSSLSRQQSGTGLGLILVQRMADLHGGSVEVESQPGQGSRFTIVLPWNKVDYSQERSHRPAARQVKEAGGIGPGASRQVLLVDDNDNNISVYSDYLQAKGYSVIAASSGLQSISLANEEHPDLILMDIQMPGMDGVEAIRRIRSSKDPAVAKTPIIALTALAMPGDREKCLQAGANDYLSKPVGLQTMIKSVEAHLNGLEPSDGEE